MRPEVKRADPSQALKVPERCWILEVANDEGDEDVSIALARVSPEVTTEWHELKDVDERYLIVSGYGRMDIGGLPSARVGSGDVVRIPANTPQRITNIGQDDLIFYCICTPRFRPHCYVRRSDLERSGEDDIVL